MIATMSAAIAHEIKQPLAAIVTNANAGLRWLNRATPDLDEARVTLEDIAASAHRANEVVQSVRGMIAKTDQPRSILANSSEKRLPWCAAIWRRQESWFNLN
jgi:C4-dicarboxylate-specific signal transduction histidine kinase